MSIIGVKREGKIEVQIFFLFYERVVVYSLYGTCKRLENRWVLNRCSNFNW